MTAEEETLSEKIRLALLPKANPCKTEDFRRLALSAWLKNDEIAIDIIEQALAAGFRDADGLAHLSPVTLASLGARAWRRRVANNPAPLAVLTIATEIMVEANKEDISAALLYAVHDRDAFDGLMAAGVVVHPSWLEVAHGVKTEERDIAARIARAISTSSGHGQIEARSRSATAITDGWTGLIARRDAAAKRFTKMMARWTKT